MKNAYYKNETELETLPNIDINIKRGNSLISRFALDADLKKALKSSKWTIDSYRIAVDTYRNAQNKEQKREMEKLIADIKSDFRSEISQNDPKVKRLTKLKGELFGMTNQTQMFEMGKKEKAAWNKKLKRLGEDSSKLEAQIEEIKNNKIYEDAFEWRFEFPEVLDDNGDFVGFDVVIGNPPYISMSKLKTESDYFATAGYETYSKGTDIYSLFYELGGQILKQQGYLTYITSNSWLRAIYGVLLKKHFIKNLQPISLLNIEDIQIFDEATVESNIITLQKRPITESFAVVNLSNDYIIGNSLSEYFNLHHFQFTIPETNEWFIGNQKVGDLKLKIETNTKLLKEYDIRINFGIKTGYNAAFIIDEAKKNELLIADKANAEIIKPIVRGRDLEKYNIEFNKQWVISTFPSWEIDIERFPSINDYLQEIGKRRLEQIGEEGTRKKTNNKWFETQDSISYWRDFEKPKIVWGEISDKPKFAFDDENYYAEATTFLMTGKKLKFLLGILNSKVSEWYFNLIGTTTGMGTNRWKKYKIELLPIKVPSIKQEEKIEQIVNQILAQKKEDSSADTTAFEAQIDQLVYQLYGLTEEEIAIVEEATG